MEEQWEKVTWTVGKRLEIGTDVRYWHATSQLQDLASCVEKLYSVLQSLHYNILHQHQSNKSASVTETLQCATVT